MALGWNTLRGLPTLRTYKDASDWEANVKPIRGDKQGLKPLGRRNQKFRHIKREADGTISVYETNQPGYLPIMTFHPDDTVTVRTSPYWLKATGHDMVRYVMGLRVYTEAGDSWASCEGGVFKLRPQPRMKYDSEKKGYLPHKNINKSVNKFKWDGGRWVFLNPLKAEVHVIDRKGAKTVRERYAAFKTYLSAMSKLRRDNPPQFEEYVETFGTNGSYNADMTYKPWWAINLVGVNQHSFDHKGAAALCKLMQSDKPEDQHKAYLWVTFHNWGSAGAEAMGRVLLMHHHSEMLKVKEREPGEKAIDRYGWAIPKPA